MNALHGYSKNMIQMKKVDLTQQFAHRLKDAMLRAGHYSKRSTSGVCIHELAKITQHSVQICRKYLRGQALPEAQKLVDIADALNVAPGWLLFGDSHNSRNSTEDNIVIQKKMLHYIFKHAHSLYNAPALNNESADFLLALTEDVSQIATDELQAEKIINLALRSVTHFRKKHMKQGLLA